MRVEVYGSVVGGEISAKKLEIKPVMAAGSGRVKGAITNFASKSNFRVAGQPVNADAISGSQSFLANGAVVEVRGSIVNGVLVATTLKLDH